MNEEWLDRLSSDTSVSPRAKQLAHVIARRFGGLSENYVAFYDTDIGAFIDLNNGEIRRTRYELQRRGYLIDLHTTNGKPAYKLRTETNGSGL